MKKLWIAAIVLCIPFGAQAGSIITRGVTDPLGIDGIDPPSNTLTITGTFSVDADSNGTNDVVITSNQIKVGLDSAGIVVIDSAAASSDSTLEYRDGNSQVFRAIHIDADDDYVIQRFDTSIKDVYRVDRLSGNIIEGDGAEGSWTWDGATGDAVFAGNGALTAAGMVLGMEAGVLRTTGTTQSNVQISSLNTNELESNVADGATSVGWITNATTALTVDGAKIHVWHNNDILQAGIYADGEFQFGAIEAADPDPNVACDNDAVGLTAYTDDTNDSSPGELCMCTDVDDGATFDYRKPDGTTSTVCDTL